MITASHQHVLCFDNVSSILSCLSDAFCRLSTGRGFATRTFYANDEETIFDVTKPIVLTGIGDIVQRPDLLERSIIITHPSIPEDQRRTESEIWERFQKLHPRLLGALFTRLSGMLRCRDQITLDRLPRMADFAITAAAAEAGAGEPASFWVAYTGNQRESEASMLEAEPLGGVLLRWLPSIGEWEGSASDLLAALAEQASESERRCRGWPNSPRAMIATLKRLAPTLRRSGVIYEASGIKNATTRRSQHRLVWADQRAGEGEGEGFRRVDLDPSD